MVEAYLTRLFKESDARTFKPGTTINEIVMEYNPASKVWQMPIVCLVNDKPALRRNDGWDLALGETDVVNFVELPMGGGGGGGSNPLKLLMTLVIAAVAYVVTGGVSAFFGGGWLGALLGGVAGGLVMAAGSLLMGAIFKTPALPSGLATAAFAETASPTYGLNASNNRARLYQPIGEGFGRMMIVPDQVAQYYGRYSENEYYLHQVFGLGRGSYQIESLSFGDSVFWKDGRETGGYEVEWKYYEAGEPADLFPDNVETSSEISGQALFAPNDPEYDGPLGPYSCNAPGTRTAMVVCNITLPQGLGRYDDNGNLQGETLSLKIEFQQIDDYGDPLSDWVPYKTPSWHFATLTAQRFSVEATLPEGRYQCRVTRTNAMDVNGRVMQNCSWESMFCYLPGTLTYNQATLALRVRATNVLSQTAANTFKVVYTRILPEYDVRSKSWSEPRPTRKFAAALSSVLMSKSGGGLDGDRIDLDALWGQIDPILTDKRWTFDGYFDGAYKVWTLVSEMCQPFRVVPRVSNGGVSFVYDRPGRQARHVFTPREIERGSFSVIYNTMTEDSPDNILWNYLDAEAGFQQREVRAALPDSATENPVSKSFIGCVDRRQAFQMGMFTVACNRHRRIQTKFRVEAIGRLLHMGDVCVVTHPFFNSLADGTVESWDAGTRSINLGVRGADHDPDTALGAKYLSINTPTGRPWGPCRVSAVKDGVAVLDKSDLASLVSGQKAGDPFELMSGIRDRGDSPTWVLFDSKTFSGRVIIQSVTPSDLYHHEITVINDSDLVDLYEDLPVPIWNYRGLDVPEEGVASLSAPKNFDPRVRGTADNAVVELFWDPVRGAAKYEVEMRVGDGGWYFLESPTANYVFASLGPGANRFRVRAVGPSGTNGPYGECSVDPAEAFAEPVELVVAGFEGGRLDLAWTYPEHQTPVVLEETVLEIMSPDNRRVLRTEWLFADDQGTPQTSYSYTLDKAVQDGGLMRELLVSIKYAFTSETEPGKTRKIDSSPAEVTARDTPPKILGSPELSVDQTSVTLNSLEIEGACVGLVVVRGTGPDFGIGQMAEMRQSNGLPFTWGGLGPDADYYFRVGAKDGLADLRGYYLDLEYTPVMTVRTLPEPEPEPDPEPDPGSGD
jgi:hypothetical protein